ncbi:MULTISPECIES: thiol reductant ABC exporter subunit CydD [unclassified Pseudoxanthomonas]|uniref:thiol reductant ABC exporter subunit CydD n=1 Tax=unclassified Pseudoxanthomonas TaxID=2645906 RepID=UPI003076B999
MDDTAAALPDPALRRSVARRLDALGAPARTRLRWAAAATVAAGWLLVPQAAMIAWAVQRVFVEGASPAAAGVPLAWLLLIGLLRAGLGWCGRRWADDAVETVRLRLRETIVRRLFAQGPLKLRQQRSGALTELMGTHVDAMEGYFGGFALARIEVVAVPLFLLAAVFFVDRIVGTVLLLTMPLIPLFMMLVGWGAEAASRRQLQALTRMSGHFADRLRGLGLIRLYGRAEAELAGIADAADSLRERSLKVLRIAFLSSAVMEFFASLSVAMVAMYLGLTYLGMLNFRGPPLTLGIGVFCLLLAPEFYAPLRRLAAHYHDRAGALAALGELETALETTFDGDAKASLASPHVEDANNERGAPAIAVRHAALKPHGAAHDVLADVSFELPTGGRLAVIGPSGCGKSTLLEALAGWLPASSGQVLVPAGTRIGYAPQRPFLFHASIADNLRMACPHATDAQLHAAAEAAQVMAFAACLPQGLDTVIGERGFGLSGGEARRIALARVFLREPSLLLLDEPTAFLDPQTEAALLRAIAEFSQGRTLVIATHSAAALRIADQVLRLPEGSLSQQVAER